MRYRSSVSNISAVPASGPSAGALAVVHPIDGAVHGAVYRVDNGKGAVPAAVNA
ncbi:hypothetical protein JHV675_55010 [Mycobacterium avium subsp. hominissuis]